MNILITEHGEIINQDIIVSFRAGCNGTTSFIVLELINSQNIIALNVITKLNSEDGENLMNKILIDKLSKDIIDMNEVKKIYKHQEFLRLGFK